MIELRNEKQRNEYVKSLFQQFDFLGAKNTEFSSEFMDEGIMNYVYRIKTGDSCFYLKQALSQIKKPQNIGKDLASITPKRTEFEAYILKKVATLFSKDYPNLFPVVLGFDKENNILILSDIQRDGYLLNPKLIEGVVDIKAGNHFGRVLGLQQVRSYGKKNVLRGSREEDLKNWLIFLNMRTRGIIKNGVLAKKTEEEIKNIYNEAKNKFTLDIVVNMDYCPKNLFIYKDYSIGIIDLELASGCGDPAYDLGFLIGWYLLAAENLPKIKNHTKKTVKAIAENYKLALKGTFSESRISEFEKRAIKYSGCTMIYKIAGTSPAPYVKKERVEPIRESGSKLITENFDCFESALKKIW